MKDMPRVHGTAGVPTWPFRWCDFVARVNRMPFPWARGATPGRQPGWYLGQHCQQGTAATMGEGVSDDQPKPAAPSVISASGFGRRRDHDDRQQTPDRTAKCSPYRRRTDQRYRTASTVGTGANGSQSSPTKTCIAHGICAHFFNVLLLTRPGAWLMKR